MLSQRYYITEPTNNQKWLLEDYKGHNFENLIYNLLILELNTLLEEDIRIEKTSGSRDDGKDIIVTSKIDLNNIMNVDFHLKGRQSINIYFECKSSDKYNIPYDSILSKVNKIKKDNIQYYVLVTNKTITANTYYQFQEELRQSNIEFYLVDQYLLYRIVKRYKDLNIPVPNLDLENKLYAEYQIFTSEYVKEYQIYILLRNYTPNNMYFHLHLLSDWNWDSQPEECKNIIEAWQYKIVRINVMQKYSDGIEDLKFYLNSNAVETIFKVKGVRASLNFESSLCGKQHKEIKVQFTNDILKKKFKMRYLFGEAGIGKTRLVDEILDNISGKNIISLYIPCNNDIETKQKILEFLYKNHLIREKDLKKCLQYYLSQLNNSINNFLIILDDIHNLDSLLEDIKSIDYDDIPEYLHILLIGRNDFSAGSIQYYNFIQYCCDLSKMKGEILHCMDNEDTEILIRSIIQDTPDIVLQRIKEASNNNPLYIIQFIEYLLELNLAHIVNRQTIGIHNIDNFSNHLYIPDQIEKLYQQRVDNLCVLDSGILMKDLLLILAFIEKPLPLSVFIDTLCISKADLNLLLFRKYIKFADYDEKKIWFYHESIFLFFKQYIRKNMSELKKILSRILKNEPLSLLLTEFQKGELYFHLGDTEKAKKYFESIIVFCESIENYTTCKTNLLYLPYLDIIFELYHNTNNTQFLKNCIIYKIYTILHYFTPIRAIEICNEAEKKVLRHKYLKKDTQFINTINTLKCHSYVNAGRLRDAETDYQKLISNYILNPEIMDNKSAFDMFDRLSGLYIRYNNYDVAKHYNEISEKYAVSMQDNTLMGLVETTRAKINFYRDTTLSFEHLLKARQYLNLGGALRNLLHNEITIAAYQILYGNVDLSRMKEITCDVHKYLKISITNQYPSLIIRSYLLLGIIDLMFIEKHNSYQSALNLIEKGIDASIQFGLPSYIWMLYNLKFIISIKRKDKLEYTEKIVETTYSHIKQQNLLNWGCRDFTYGNIPVVTNLLRFYAEHKFESEFYRKVAQINFQNKSISYDIYDFVQRDFLPQYPDIEKLRDEYRNILQGKLLYMDKNTVYKVKDVETGYFIVFA